MSRARDIADLSSVSARLDTLGASEGALSNRNIIINGAMKVAQRGTSSTGLGASDGYFTCDRWNMGLSTAGRLTMTQESDGPDGFANSIKLACTTADTSIAATEVGILRQLIEGQDLQRFAKGTTSAKEFTVSFYVKGNAAATYTAELFDNDNSRQISKTFSVTTSWTRVALTYPADTTGAFDDDANLSLYLQIWLHAGSNFTSGTLNSTSWAANTNANRVSSSGSSFFDSTSRTFFITGVQLEVGSEATPFEHRTFGDELAKCQRYYTRFFETGGSGSNAYLRYGYGTCENTTRAEIPINSHTVMRADPTLETTGTFSNYALWQRGSIVALTNLTVEGSGHSNGQLFTLTAVASGLNAGDCVGLLNNNSTTAFLAFDAEL